MSGLFDRFRGRAPGRGSRSTAKERLQFILVHDRINLPPEKLQAMKAEIMEVISKYVQVDGDNVEVALQQRDRDSLIVAEIPFTNDVMDRDEARRRLAKDNLRDTLPDDADLDDG